MDKKWKKKTAHWQSYTYYSELNTPWLTALLSYSFSLNTQQTYTQTHPKTNTEPHKCTANNNKNTDDDDANDNNEREITVDARSDANEEGEEKNNVWPVIMGMHWWEHFKA